MKSFHFMPQRSELEVNIAKHNTESDKCKMPQRSETEVKATQQVTQSDKCKNRCRPPGSEAWPEGMIAPTSDLRMRARPLWGALNDDIKSKPPSSLLAIAAGIKQKELVNKIVTKFLECNFSVMIFHYDGVVDQWKDLGWNSRVIHVSAVNQTKWYVSIVREEELEISQPALDPGKSEVHHQITVRRRNSKVHSWVKIMAPVFSKAAWRCSWYLIQSDLIHAWGIDFQLGYCAKGDRKKHVVWLTPSIIVHLGVPTLGGSGDAKSWSALHPQHSETKNLIDPEDAVTRVDNTNYHLGDSRSEVRRQSYIELRIFWHRWWRAIEDDKCWVDRYKLKKNETKKKCLVHPCHPSKIPLT